MKRTAIMICVLIPFVTLILGCTQNSKINDTEDRSFSPQIIFQGKLYVTSPNHPEPSLQDTDNLIAVGVIETTTSLNLREQPTENFQSNFGMVGHEIYISSDHSDVLFVLDDGEFYPYTLYLEE